MLSHVRLFAILQVRILEWIASPSPGNPPNPGIKPTSPALQADSSHCGQILYQLSYKESPRTLERVADPFSSRSSQPRNQARVSALQADSLPTELSGKPNFILRLSVLKSNSVYTATYNYRN